MVLYDKTNPNLNAKAAGPLNLSDEEQAEAIKTIENMRRSLDFFAQNGVDMITDFELPEHIESSGDTSTGFMGADRFINNYKNAFGRSQVVLVSSQNGVPIGLFRGDKCTVTIPNNLPKTTLINIDGKLVYIHRGIVDIIPTGLFDN